MLSFIKSIKILFLMSILLILFLLLNSEFLYGQINNIENNTYISNNQELSIVKQEKIINLIRTIKNIHTKTINDIEYDPVNNYFVTASNDNTVKVFNFDTGENISCIREYYNNVLDIAFNDDYSLLATCDNDGYLMIFKYPELIILKTIYAHYDSAKTLTFTRDGTKIISAGNDGLVKIWDVENEFNIIASFEAHQNFITKVVTDVSSKYIITASEDNTLKLFDFKSTELIHCFKGHIDYIRGLDVAPNSKYIISGDDSGEIIVWNTITGKLVHKIQFHKDFIRNIKISPDGKSFIVASDDKTISHWNIETYELLHVYIGFTDWIFDAIITPNQDYIIAVDDSYNALVMPFSLKAINEAYFDNQFIAGNEEYYNYNHTIFKLLYKKTSTNKSGITNLAINLNYNLIATSFYNGYIELWKINNNKPIFIKKFKAHNSNISCIEISQNGNYIITSSFDGKIKIWTNEGYLKSTINNEALVNCIKITKDSKTLISTDLKKNINIWNIKTGKLEYRKIAPSLISSIYLDKKNKYLLVGCISNKAILYFFPDMQILREIKTNAPVKKAILTKNNIILSTNRGDLILFAIKKGKIKQLENINTYSIINTICYTSITDSELVQGKKEYIITTNNAGKLMLWELKEGAIFPIKKINVCNCRNVTAILSKDSKFVFVSGDDGSLRIYTLFFYYKFYLFFTL